MISECTRATALYLLIAEGTEQEAAIDYLVRVGVWNRSISDTAALVHCLLQRSEGKLAREISQKALQARKWARAPPQEFDEDAPLKAVLEKGLSWLRPTGADLLAKALVKGLLRFTGPDYWADRSSQVYSYVPLVFAPMTADRGESDRLREVLNLTQNRDGSCGGIATSTIICAYMLRELGDDSGFRKAADWVRRVRNPDGSLRPILFQDVYDTAWASIYNGRNSEADKSISWLGGTGSDRRGYPYLSEGYYPDCDDSALVLLARQGSGGGHPRRDLAKFLLDSQNPDGGWGYVSLWTLKRALPYRALAERSTLVRNGCSRLGGRLFWSSSFDSTVDMTSRVMISLSAEPDSQEKSQAVAAGARFLWRSHRGGFYHGSFRWTDSDSFESSLAILALSLNGLSDVRTSATMEMLLSAPPTGADATAHVLWAAVATGASHERRSQLVSHLLSTQNEDGSWPPTLKFKADSYFMDPFFSTVMPLLSLKRATGS
ncbi:MAG TPA: prenyltransferase/squalene oxidase repeat-containing protein [Nitrososphaerales archaeon]|nr:prenyltransferase/squalene oxidase repeat-containing protein [Nitrososphaerales archaeon]